MAKILELPDKKFNVTVTSVLKALMEMLENMQINRMISVDESETMRKRLMEVLEPKNTVEWNF